MRNLKKFKKYEINGLNKVTGGSLSTSYEAGNYSCADQWYLFAGNNPTGHTGSVHTEYTTNCSPLGGISGNT